MIFDLLKKQTRDDPQFGLLVKKWGTWTGTLRSPLFPETDLPISIKASDEDQLALFRRHLAQVVAHADTLRAQIASEALATYQAYQEAEGDTEPYETIATPEEIWPLIRPREWRFEITAVEYTSHVVLDFGWPNPHFLVAYLADAELYQLDVAG